MTEADFQANAAAILIEIKRRVGRRQHGLAHDVTVKYLKTLHNHVLEEAATLAAACNEWQRPVPVNQVIADSLRMRKVPVE